MGNALSHHHSLEHLPTPFSGSLIHPAWKRFLRAMVIWMFFVVTWIVFFAIAPGEEKTPLQAFYMGVITMTTIGFGDIVPKTEGGKLFATIWMLLGVAALANMVAKFSEAFLPEDKQY